MDRGGHNLAYQPLRVEVTPMTQKFGYSGKSLAIKLGVRPGQQLLAIDAPANYAQMVAPLPEAATMRLGTWGETNGSAGLIHAFFPIGKCWRLT
ncbi:MAG: hypothetical protein JO188_11595 [Hyphomicrobiales bacterium]|nr:hypothetical protein [Hyphomicrobiales bacterium]